MDYKTSTPQHGVYWRCQQPQYYMWKTGPKNNIQADLHSYLNRKKGQVSIQIWQAEPFFILVLTFRKLLTVYFQSNMQDNK